MKFVKSQENPWTLCLGRYSDVRKLLKYEAKATARSFLPIYLAILLFALINRVINPFDKVSDGVSVTVEEALASLI